jgi:hypothetical protein
MTHALRSEKVTMYSGGVLLRRGMRFFVRSAARFDTCNVKRGVTDVWGKRENWHALPHD